MPLLERQGCKVHPTPYGEVIASASRRMLDLVGDLATALQCIEGLETGRLVLGASATVAGTWLPQALGQYRRVSGHRPGGRHWQQRARAAGPARAAYRPRRGWPHQRRARSRLDVGLGIGILSAQTLDVDVRSGDVVMLPCDDWECHCQFWIVPGADRMACRAEVAFTDRATATG